MALLSHSRGRLTGPPSGRSLVVHKEVALLHRLPAAAAGAALLALPLQASTPLHRYTLDAASAVQARVAFFGLSSKTAGFPRLTGQVVLDPARLDRIDLDVSIDARAITAPDKVTLARLKGKDFFDVEHYPTVRYRGTAMTMTGPASADVRGELTARGVTRPSILKVTFATPPGQITGREPVAITGRTEIDRRDFGMTAWPMIVGRKVTITLKARMVPG